MSIPRNDPGSAGSYEQFRIEWSSFVSLVLEVTVQAYQQMAAAKVARITWAEDTFTHCLGDDYIRPLAHDSYLLVSIRTKVATAEIKAGDVPPSHAKELDMYLFGTWEQAYTSVHFVWEAKLISDRSDVPKPNNYVSEYIGEGMLRFIDGMYASAVSDAGMIGYVLVGKPASIVDKINQSMHASTRRRQLGPHDRLAVILPIAGFADVFTSNHQRPSLKRDIRLHHLFLTFGL